MRGGVYAASQSVVSVSHWGANGQRMHDNGMEGMFGTVSVSESRLL